MLKAAKFVSLRAAYGGIVKEEAKGNEPWDMPEIPNAKRYRLGIAFIVAGLTGEIIATFFYKKVVTPRKIVCVPAVTL